MGFHEHLYPPLTGAFKYREAVWTTKLTAYQQIIDILTPQPRCSYILTPAHVVKRTEHFSHRERLRAGTVQPDQEKAQEDILSVCTLSFLYFFSFCTFLLSISFSLLCSSAFTPERSWLSFYLLYLLPHPPFPYSTSTVYYLGHLAMCWDIPTRW